MKGRGRRDHTSAFGRRWACPESARGDYARVISDRKWPLKKTPVIAHIKARSKHSFLTINRNDLKKCIILYGCIQSVDWTSGLDYWTDRFSFKTHLWRLYNEVQWREIAAPTVETLRLSCLGFTGPAYQPRPLSWPLKAQAKM